MLVTKGKFFYIRAFLFAIYFINGLFYIAKQSFISDEADHWNYSIRWLRGKPEKVKPFDDASTMPITAINTLPRVTEQVLQINLEKGDWGISDIINGRYITFLFCSFIGVFIYKWTAELYGESAGLFSLFLFVFCPNLNAHIGFVTTDAYAALFTLITCYYFWKLHHKSSWKYLFLFSFFLGITQVTKQTLVHLFIIFFVVTFSFQLIKKDPLFNIKEKLLKLFVAISVVLLIINVGFQFNHSLRSLNDYQFKSKTFRNIQESIGILSYAPLPFPAPYIEGLDLVKNMVEIGAGDPRVSPSNYVLGEKRNGRGFWYFYFVILLVKTPIIVLICLFFLFFKWTMLKFKNASDVTLFLLFVIIYFFTFLNFFVSRQVGIRHILIIYPLIYVLLGKTIMLIQKNKHRKYFFYAAIIYSITTFYYFFPNLIAYTNELIIDKGKVYKIIADSNLDWGQGEKYLKSYLAKHPEVKRPNKIPESGQFILSVNDYIGLSENDSISWLKNFKPVKQVYFSYLLFYIKKEEINLNEK